MHSSDDYIKRILNAKVYAVARQTKLDTARELSKRLGNTVLLKREDTQPVFSFKLRGAYNKIASLTPEERARGVIAASAGNHAQGVALAASKLGIDALIVMPDTTPQIKVDAVRAFGGTPLLHGAAYDEAACEAHRLCAQSGRVFIHPYDDPEVIAGQGTVAMEILGQHPGPIKAIFVPVGGGGLLAGVVAYVKYLRPEIKVIGVEPNDAGCLYAALEAGERVVLDQVGLFADGVAVRQVGEEPYRVVKGEVDEVILVSADEICAAIKDIFEDTRSIAEPAGALALAGMKRYIEREELEGESLVAIVSGANTNFDRLRHVAERAEIGEKRESLLAVTIDERPGSFRKFCRMIGSRAVTEFNYRYADADKAHVFVGIKMAGGLAERNDLIELLRADAYPVLDMSDNEMAKLHVRYMVGGRALVENERLIRFEFPERPGALMRFLDEIGGRWNISLFHYRNHGADYGRVLAGIQVPEEEGDRFDHFLTALGYRWWEESDNPVYRLFLRG